MIIPIRTCILIALGLNLGFNGGTALAQSDLQPEAQSQTGSNPNSIPFVDQSPLIQQVQPGSVDGWFRYFDDVRKRTLMSPDEARRVNWLIDNPDVFSEEDRNMLTDLIKRYQSAQDAMRNIDPISESDRLQRGFFQYVTMYSTVFADLIKWHALPLSFKQASMKQAVHGLKTQRAAIARLEQGNNFLEDNIRRACGVRPAQ